MQVRTNPAHTSKLPNLGGLDLSPMVVILIIIFLQKFAVDSLYDLGYRMKMGGGFH